MIFAQGPQDHLAFPSHIFGSQVTLLSTLRAPGEGSFAHLADVMANGVSWFPYKGGIVVYTANRRINGGLMGIIYHLPPFKGTRNSGLENMITTWILVSTIFCFTNFWKQNPQDSALMYLTERPSTSTSPNKNGTFYDNMSKFLSPKPQQNHDTQRIFHPIPVWPTPTEPGVASGVTRAPTSQRAATAAVFRPVWMVKVLKWWSLVILYCLLFFSHGFLSSDLQKNIAKSDFATNQHAPEIQQTRNLLIC